MSSEPPVLARRALDHRIERHHRDLVAFLARRVASDAEELAQETWMRVARAAPDCADDAAFRAYAFTVARRLLIDHHRRRAARVTLVPLVGGLEGAEDRRSDPHGHAAAGQILAVVERALAAMKPELAEVFRLRSATALSFEDIASRQGVSLNTALGRQHQATKQIHRALSNAGLIEEER